ncbi:MAG: hypothetical protein A3I75_01990 [Deltaproteobacteria bacterium RIFCSPLOWO2_02_FULL_50_16]|nr:MAG: hypothetical protein A2053_03840 [Deltaproteobacteria bacterium GWA2_50_8]OGQ25706.1 MAG: hypothetical protein A3B79_07155 [Deltaproteobacteria bacterium RIFCSPHIGHO2_02_FULL_50_15]OGQ56969.1 MAG: hypothetical protein A3I75_01990 [Deltaproteobacteria bacterium RIFCSPLOWO2_02_FULL_50_16]OGQ68047.1 MAG: hypothetical protein A3F89_05685 [Deltaproteobacteria bacterium RIFCSPLOWO2_12_FULL_50_11]
MKKRKNADYYKSKGEKLYKKGHLKKALEQYKLSHELSPDDIGIYDKLMEIHQKIEKKWDEDDFADHLYWTMKKQELENPSLAHTHERLTPEYEAVRKTVTKLLREESEEMEEKMINQIVEYKEKAVLPLIDFILQIKKIKGPKEDSNKHD